MPNKTFILSLLIAFYKGKSPNDPEVQLRAPVDIFYLLEEIIRLEAQIQDLLFK